MATAGGQLSAVRALIASGAGRYADPWHPFGRTTPRVAGLLTEAGFAVDIHDDVDGAMTRLEGVDLLVVNAGDPWADTDERLPAGHPGPASLASALNRGLGVLALHCAVASLRDYPVWAAATGGIWVPGQSWHPPHGTATIHWTPPDDTPGRSFEVEDERYLSLQLVGPRRVVATHDGPHGPEPTAWERRHGAARVAVDLLGHDERSYDSAGHRELLRDLALWAATGSGPLAG
ncbi:ThuA domain-containing protein [Tessaracoccus sp. G1721]